MHEKAHYTWFSARWGGGNSALHKDFNLVDRFSAHFSKGSKNELFSPVTKCAFTLAEVLITLGIIGVVAAMTLPGLIQNYQKYVLNVQYKKAVSVLSNAIQLAMSKNGTPGDISSLQLLKCSNENDTACLNQLSKELFNVVLNSQDNQEFKNEIEAITYMSNSNDDESTIRDNEIGNNIFMPPAYASLSPGYQINRAPSVVYTPAWTDYPYFFVTPDGMIFGYDTKFVCSDLSVSSTASKEEIGVVIDINGTKKPNKINEDFFSFVIDKQGIVKEGTKLKQCGLELLQ